MDPSFPVPRAADAPRFLRLRVVAALVIREMATSFGKSAGGYFWALAEPLGGIALLALAFSLALRAPPLGTSFILFYATGMVPFTMYRDMAGGVSRAVAANRGLLKYPVVTALDAVFAKVALNFVTVVMIALVLYVALILGFAIDVNLDLAAVVLACGLAAVLGLGIGAMNCVLFGFFPTWRNIWNVLTRPLFLVSCIFYTFESLPPAFQALLWWNPLVHVIGLMRAGFYGAYDPHYVSIPYVLGLGLGLFVLGAYLLRRHETFLIEQ